MRGESSSRLVKKSMEGGGDGYLGVIGGGDLRTTGGGELGTTEGGKLGTTGGGNGGATNGGDVCEFSFCTIDVTLNVDLLNPSTTSDLPYTHLSTSISTHRSVEPV